MRGRPPRWIKPKLQRPYRPYVDMNRPGSPDYAERHRETVTEIAGGMRRVDLGEPVRAPGRKALPVTKGTPPAPAEAEGVPSSPAPSVSPPPTVERDWRSDYGLRKGS